MLRTAVVKEYNITVLIISLRKLILFNKIMFMIAYNLLSQFNISYCYTLCRNPKLFPKSAYLLAERFHYLIQFETTI